MERRKKCISCGASLPQEASFCPCCTASQLTREPMSPPNGETRRGVLACALLLLVLTGAALWASLSGRAVPQPELQPNPEPDAVQSESEGLTGAYQSDGCQTWYDGADGRLYHVFACFSPQPDGGALPSARQSELLPAGEPGTSPICLFVEDAEGGLPDVRENFRALMDSYTVQAVAGEGSSTCLILEETDAYDDAGALLAREHQVNSDCTYNDIIWTLHMKNGDEILLRQVVECGEKEKRTVSWEDTPMATTAELQALLDGLTADLALETELEIQLPNVTYTEPLTIRRPVTLCAHADGTEFQAPVTVESIAYSDVTDIHVTLQGLRICAAGEQAGTGVTARAPTYLNNCFITGWETGAAAENGGWLYVQRSTFNRNGTGLRIDTADSSSWGGNLDRGNFVRIGTAIDARHLPGVWQLLRVADTAFSGNDTVLTGAAADQVLLEDSCYVA